MVDIVGNLAEIKLNIAKAAAKVNRNAEDIKLIAVTKTRDVATIQTAIAAGITRIGENRVQEIQDKYDAIGPTVEWHMIGHLQTNKVKYIIDKVDLIHSLDRLSLAEELQARVKKPVNVLVQVNVSGEESKFGIEPAAATSFIRQVAQDYPLIKIKGLMTVAPFVDDPEETRPVFRGLRDLAAEIAALAIPGVEMTELSMGMTNDYLVAIEEGATMVRIGTAIFGPRPR